MKNNWSDNAANSTSPRQEDLGNTTRKRLRNEDRLSISYPQIATFIWVFNCISHRHIFVAWVEFYFSYFPLKVIPCWSPVKRYYTWVGSYVIIRYIFGSCVTNIFQEYLFCCLSPTLHIWLKNSTHWFILFQVKFTSVIE